MALTKCKECGHDVSTTAATCPNCGAPDFLSEEAKEILRKERQREQLKIMVEKGGTDGLLPDKKRKKEKRRKAAPAPRPVVVSGRQPRESSVSKGFGLGCGLVFGIIAANIVILVIILLLGFRMCG